MNPTGKELEIKYCLKNYKNYQKLLNCMVNSKLLAELKQHNIYFTNEENLEVIRLRNENNYNFFITKKANLKKNKGVFSMDNQDLSITASDFFSTCVTKILKPQLSNRVSTNSFQWKYIGEIRNNRKIYPFNDVKFEIDFTRFNETDESFELECELEDEKMVELVRKEIENFLLSNFITFEPQTQSKFEKLLKLKKK